MNGKEKYRRNSGQAGRASRLAVLMMLTSLLGCGPRTEPAQDPGAPVAEPPVPIPTIPDIPISRLDESPLVGRWEVVDYHITPVAAVDEEMALAWLGQLVIYSAEVVGFRDELCDKPAFREHTEPFAQYFEDFEVNPAQFDIVDPDVDVISVDCYGEKWTGPGSEVIRVRGDSLVLIFDGVFMTMEPYVTKL